VVPPPDVELHPVASAAAAPASKLAAVPRAQRKWSCRSSRIRALPKPVEFYRCPDEQTLPQIGDGNTFVPATGHPGSYRRPEAGKSSG
jgi:hypothetical protein